MQDNLKDHLSKLDIPEPSADAKARALQAAIQAFEKAQEKTNKGFTDTIRPIRTTNTWDTWMRSISMKKAYVVAGSFAVAAVALAVTTTHYSTFYDLVKPAQIKGVEPQAPQATNVQEVPLKEVDKDSELKKESANVATVASEEESVSSINMDAPGLAGAANDAVMAPTPQAPPAPQVMALNKTKAHRDYGRGRVAQEMVMGGGSGGAVGMAAPGIPMLQSEMMPYSPSPVYYGGDQFEGKQANAAKQVTSEPVSTFSIDVDTASYSFVRRMLGQGQLPQPEMVRVEEMVNYFPYHYTLPEDKAEPFKPTITVYPSPWNSDRKLVHIGIKGYDINHATRPAANLVFLIDVSGSMNQPDKLPLLKSSLHMLVDQMNESDTVSIVTYAGRAGTALSPTRGTDKQKIRSVIDMLGAGGSTAGAAGIEEAYQLASQHFNKDGVNRVILATDGDFNVGISNPEQLKTFIEQKRQTGIMLSVLGFGQGNYNDALMQSLAQSGNGNAAYIDNLNEARKVLVDEMSATLFTIAKDVKIQVEWNPAAVSEYRLVGYETRLLNREDFNNDKVDAGDVGAGHTVTAIYEITPKGARGTNDPLRYSTEEKKHEDVAAPAEFTGEYGFLKMRYKLPDASESKLITARISNAEEVTSVDAASEDVRFATAVAGFAQMLKQDPAVAGLSFEQVITLADGARGTDTHGLRGELVNLVRTAKSLQLGNGGYPIEEPYPMPRIMQ